MNIVRWECAIFHYLEFQIGVKQIRSLANTSCTCENNGGEKTKNQTYSFWHFNDIHIATALKAVKEGRFISLIYLSDKLSVKTKQNKTKRKRDRRS